MLGQLLRYGLVGIASNAAGYLLYLLATAMGAEPKLAMTLLYASGAALGFFGNRRLTFTHGGAIVGSAVRYAVAHAIGYGINLTLLLVGVDRYGLPHQGVQLVAIVMVAGWLFLAFRYYVFPDGVIKTGEAT